MDSFSLTRRAALTLTALLATSSAMALSPPPPQWRPPTVVIQGPGQQVELRAVTIRSTVAGGLAQTEVEMRLFNPNPRVMEGELQFPLLEGQVVTGFALDVNGQLRDASPVPKARGQEIFEDIRRRGVDPGLLEATAGNQYKLRVYPFMPRSERRVAITITESLPREAGASLLRIPLVFAGKVAALDVSVHAPGAAVRELQVLSAPEGTQPASDGQGASLRLSRQNWEAPSGTGGWLRLAVRQPDRAQLLLGETGGKRFFAGHTPVRDELVRRPDPRHVALVWDASGSSAQQTRILPLLDAWFRAQRQDLRVSLVVVRNRAEAPREFNIAPDGFAALAQVLRALPRDGSSNFDDLPIPADADLTLMVTDGLMTDGRRMIGYRHRAPLIAINGATSADAARLTRIAERTGGSMIDATQSVQQALRGMLYHGWRIERLQSVTAQSIVSPSLAVQQGRIAIAGELIDENAVVEVGLSHPDGRKRLLRTALPRQAKSGRWPGQLWAQWRSAQLAENPALHTNELQRIAAEHRIAGPNSSLIVLELASDYAQYDLPAPAELAAEVAQLRQQRGVQQRQSQYAHIENVVRQFEERKRWWERDLPLESQRRGDAPASSQGAIGRQELLIERRRAQESVAAAAPVMRAAPPQHAAPAPAFAQQRNQDASQELSKKSASPAQRDAAPSIALRAWTPDAPYLRRLHDAPPNELYEAYLDERTQFADSSAFFMDVADMFFGRGNEELALRVLSNLAEMNLESRQLLRLYAHRLVQAKRNDLAVNVFERISALAPNEPQSWRDLGLALAQTGQPQRAVDNLWEVVARPWHARFAGVNLIALAELNAIAARELAGGRPLDLSRVDPRLHRNLPLAVRVVMGWDTDDTNIDLIVTDPNGEAASPGHRLTSQGGSTSANAHGGYGPEEFALRKALPGKYLIQARFTGHRQQVVSAGTTVTVRVTTGFGTPQAKDEWMTVRLTRPGETVRLGEVDVQ